jgi:predicted nucleotidyltransferase
MKSKTGFRSFRIKGGDKQVKKYIENLREQIVRAVRPQKIILFGSYAYGQPDVDSDVDLLVVMPFEGHPAYQATKIRSLIKSPVPLDLLVRTPQFIARRLAMEDFFMQDIVEQGKVIYEADHAGMDQQSRR